MSSITRRHWLGAGIALAGSKAAVNAAKPEKAGHQDRLFLECKWIEKTIDGVRVKLRSYNGKVPGELITTRGGDTLRIRVKNSLPRVDSAGWDGSHNVPHMFDATNLHLHGLDIIPASVRAGGNGNPLAKMIDIMPGESYDYDFQIPIDQPPGLAWYHPASSRVDRGAGRERDGRSPDHLRRHRRSARD